MKTSSLITDGLGYCCEWLFFHRFKDRTDSLIAARLGVSPRTVRQHRIKVMLGQLGCEAASCCMRAKLLRSLPPVVGDGNLALPVHADSPIEDNGLV